MVTAENNEWVVQQIRVSAFSNVPFPSSETEWTKLTGETEAQSRSSVPGGRQFSSDGFGGLLALTAAGPRLDIVATLNPNRFEVAMHEGVMVSLGLWPDLSRQFVDQVNRYLQQVELPLVRLAFGAVVHLQRESQLANYQKLRDLLKSVKVEPGAMRELVYRVNWPLESQVVDNLQLNRLTTWSSLMTAYGTFSPPVGGAGAASHFTTGTHHAVSLEIDNNSAADRKEEIPKNLTFQLLQELVSLANENIERGERP